MRQSKRDVSSGKMDAGAGESWRVVADASVAAEHVISVVPRALRQIVIPAQSQKIKVGAQKLVRQLRVNHKSQLRQQQRLHLCEILTLLAYNCVGHFAQSGGRPAHARARHVLKDLEEIGDWLRLLLDFRREIETGGCHALDGVPGQSVTIFYCGKGGSTYLRMLCL